VLDYRTAITATEDTIHRRAALFRNQAIAVVVVLAFTLLYSLVATDWRPLFVLLVLVPMCGAFFIADDRTVDRWRQWLLSAWAAREIDFDAFKAALRAHPRLPRRTLDGMLDTLPVAGDLTSEQALQSSTRQAIAAACAASHRRQSDVLRLRVLASAIVAVAALGAVWTGIWPVLIATVALVMLPVVGAWLRRRRRARCQADIAACRLLPDFDETGYERAAARFP
jgi:hypothetical protein